MTSIVCMSNGISVFHTHFADHDLASGHAQKTTAKKIKKAGSKMKENKRPGFKSETSNTFLKTVSAYTMPKQLQRPGKID